MQAFGSDRVRQGDGEQIVLSSRLSKGWTPRVERTVVSAEDLQHGGVRYVLEPWRDHHAMRVTDRYDAESEAGRVEEHRRSLKQESARKTANLGGIVTGSLPALVQEHFARELGIMAPRLTFISVCAEWLMILGLVLWSVSYLIKEQ